MFPESDRRTARRYLKQASANNLAPRVFTSAKLAMLKLLASQAAILLQHVPTL